MTSLDKVNNFFIVFVYYCFYTVNRCFKASNCLVVV